MKQAQNARKQRGRASSRKNNQSNNNGGHNRQDMKVRGNPKQLLEKYKTQAREALQAGDRVDAEYYFQFADHYQRVLNAMRGPNEVANSSDDEQDSGSGSEQQEGNRFRRNGRGRDRERPPREVRDDREVPAGESATKPLNDLAGQEQPAEVHPELDLQGTVADKDQPRRRRGPARFKKTEENSEAAVPAEVSKTVSAETAPVVGEAPVADTSAEVSAEKPKRAPARRRKAAKAEEVAEADAIDEKPKRRTRTSKKVADAEPAAVQAEEIVAEEKPKRKPRARKKPTEEETPAD